MFPKILIILPLAMVLMKVWPSLKSCWEGEGCGPFRKELRFVTGAKFELVEQLSFTWTIEGFAKVLKDGSLINAQMIDFTAGATTDHPSEWNLRLRENRTDTKRYMGIWLRLHSPNPPDARLSALHVEIRLQIRSGRFWKISLGDATLGPVNIATNFVGNQVGQGREFGFPHFIDADMAFPVPVEDLVFEITFSLYSVLQPPQPKSTSSIEAILEKFQVNFSDQYRKDFAFAGLMRRPSPDIKLISSDKKEFTIQRGILAARSKVFAAMLSSDKAEGNSGVMELPDMSSNSTEVLLTFLNKGELHPDWNQAELLVELTNAAGKYQLPDLLKFLDMTLGKICKMENVLELFSLAHQLSLKTAEEELSKYMGAHMISPEATCKMLKVTCAFGLNGPVPSQNTDAV